MSARGQLPSVVLRPGPQRPPSWRARAIRVALLLWPVAELGLLIEVGSRLGIGLTLLLLLGGVVAGTLVLRRVGVATLARLTVQPAPAGAPTVLPRTGRPAAETALMVTAGLLLLVPGFLSDAVALALLVPPVRHALARRAGEAVMRRFTTRSVRVVRGQVIKENPAAGPDTGIRVVRAPEGEESPPR